MMGHMAYKLMKKESVNEGAYTIMNVNHTVSTTKKKLMKKWKQKGGYENFGQKELDILKKKLNYNPYGSDEERKIAKILDNFNNWAMTYDGSMRESVNEAKSMDMKKRLKVYDKLKKGDKITIKYGSSMRGGVEKEFVVSKGKTLVGKQKVERIILQNPANPKGVKYYLYQRNGNVTMAIGDMAATIEDMHESIDESTGLAIIHKAAKKGSYPVSIVATMLGKVVKQELVKTPMAVPAAFRMMQGGYPRATIAIEDRTGKILFKEGFVKESVNEGMFKVIDQIRQDSKDAGDFIKNVFSDPDFKDMKKDKDFLKYLKSIYEGFSVVEEYDVENEQDIKEFVNFMKEYKADINEAEYQGRDVKLGKIMQGDVKKFKVYVKNPKGNVVKVNFGHKGKGNEKTMSIKKNNPERRKAFRARHNCDNPGPRHKARYWSCKKW
jgi:hypothetical protein